MNYRTLLQIYKTICNEPEKAKNTVKYFLVCELADHHDIDDPYEAQLREIEEELGKEEKIDIAKKVRERMLDTYS